MRKRAGGRASRKVEGRCGQQDWEENRVHLPEKNSKTTVRQGELGDSLGRT